MIGHEFGFNHELLERGRLLSGGPYKDICIKVDCISKKLRNVERNLGSSLNFVNWLIRLHIS